MFNIYFLAILLILSITQVLFAQGKIMHYTERVWNSQESNTVLLLIMDTAYKLKFSLSINFSYFS